MNRIPKSEIEKSAEYFMETAKKVFLIQGYHDPMTIYFTKENGIRMVNFAEVIAEAEKMYEVGDIERAYAAKAVMAEAMKEHAVKYDAFGAITIAEAWQKIVKPGEVQIVGGDEPGMGGLRGPNPRFSPDRKEVITLNYEFRLPDDAKCSGAMTVEIIRNGEKVTFGPPKVSVGMSDGLMSGIIK